MMALYAEWNKHPPISLIVAAYLGFKPQQKGKPEEFAMSIAALPCTKIEKVKKNG
jgi:hypothetical protein